MFLESELLFGGLATSLMASPKQIKSTELRKPDGLGRRPIEIVVESSNCGFMLIRRRIVDVKLLKT